MEMSKGWLQEKPRQEGPWCALKEPPNIKGAFTLNVFRLLDHEVNPPLTAGAAIKSIVSALVKYRNQLRDCTLQVPTSQIPWSCVWYKGGTKRRDKEENTFFQL